MIKDHYQKYVPNAQDWHAAERLLRGEQRKQVNNGKGRTVTFAVTFSGRRKQPSLKQMNKPLRNQGLKNGAGDGDRTHDLMLGKHTL